MNDEFTSLFLGLALFSFLITGLLIIPYINLLYKLNFTRRKEAPEKGEIPLFDRLHDIKTGTPVGGGILIIILVSLFFAMLFPFSSHMGVYIKGAFDIRTEVFIIFFTFISFGVLGLTDDIIKLFGKPRKGAVGVVLGLTRRVKFVLQWVLAIIVSVLIYSGLGVQILHIPLIDHTLDLGIFFIPFAAFVIVTFTNAVNITDGLDGLATGLLIICLGAFGIIAASVLDTPLSLFISLWLGTLIAFLYFNVWPARIILGDTGALSFGAMFAVIGLLTGKMIALTVIGGIFLLEIVSSAIQIFGWKALKRPIFPLAPIHHAFLAIGWEEPKIVMRAWLAGLVLAIFGLWLATI